MIITAVIGDTYKKFRVEMQLYLLSQDNYKDELGSFFTIAFPSYFLYSSFPVHSFLLSFLPPLSFPHPSFF